MSIDVCDAAIAQFLMRDSLLMELDEGRWQGLPPVSPFVHLFCFPHMPSDRLDARQERCCL
jgi:hypothetical protein